MASETRPRQGKIAVVGAGPGGLTAAMILAHRGFAVDVYEAKPHVGGRNACMEVGPYKFDVGPTFLMMRQILDEVFEESGTSSTDHMEFVRLDPMYRLVFERFSLDCSSDPEKTRASIAKALPGHESCFDAFMQSEKRRFDVMAPCLQQSYGSLPALLSRNLRRALPRLSLGRTVFDVLRGYFGDPDLALAFSFQSKYLGMSPWECPGAFAMLAYIEYAFGVYHVMGGLSEISRTMAEVARQNGATIHLETPVRQVVVKNGKARGVELPDGERREYDEVIVNADFGYAATHLFPQEALRRWAPAKLGKKRLSCSTFMLYLGLDKTYDLPHHCICMARDYHKNVNDIFRNKVLSEDTSFYVRNASVTDDRIAPEGHSALYVLVPVANLRAEIDWDQETPRFRRRVFDTMKDRLGLDDVEAHTVEERIITPRGWQDDYNVYGGATFNLAHNLGQMLYLRPHNKFEEFDNCYLVGGGTHPGSGVPTILESGRIAANMISRDYGVAFESKNPFA